MEPGSPKNPLRVAIIGSGPSGFYAAEALFMSQLEVRVDMIERLPVPFGLVRHGVAPDHPRLKQPAQLYDEIARSPNFRFFGNVNVGKDVEIPELLETHHAVIIACGAQADRKLGIPGELLRGSHTASELVGWYNGHPDYADRHFDLDNEVAVIVGQGNVAADVARILLKPVDALRTTDIAQHALAALEKSRVREVHVVGRRGIAQAKFTTKELRELGELANCRVELGDGEPRLGETCLEELKDRNGAVAAKNVELFRSWIRHTPAGGKKRLVFHFLRSPVAITGGTRVESIMLERNRLSGAAFNQTSTGTKDVLELPCGLVFSSIGYFGTCLKGVPFETRAGVIPTTSGRVVGEKALYATGWIRRGPSGIIGTNRADAFETVESLISQRMELAEGARAGSDRLRKLLEDRGVRIVDYGDWLKIDALEKALGVARDKPREKFVRIQAMLDAVGPGASTG